MQGSTGLVGAVEHTEEQAHAAEQHDGESTVAQSAEVQTVLTGWVQEQNQAPTGTDTWFWITVGAVALLEVVALGMWLWR
jgi:hypothetical protein